MDPELFAAVFSSTSPRRERTVSLLSFFFLFEREEKLGELWESRRSKAASFSQDWGPTVAVWLSRFESSPTWLPRKGSSPDHPHSLVHVLQERSYTTGGFKETTVGVLSGEFRAEALVVASLRFTAIITRTLLDVASDYRALSNAFALGAFSGKASVVCRLSTRRLRRVLAKWVARVRCVGNSLWPTPRTREDGYGSAE